MQCTAACGSPPSVEASVSPLCVAHPRDGRRAGAAANPHTDDLAPEPASGRPSTLSSSVAGRQGSRQDDLDDGCAFDIAPWTQDGGRLPPGSDRPIRHQPRQTTPSGGMSRLTIDGGPLPSAAIAPPKRTSSVRHLHPRVHQWLPGQPTAGIVAVDASGDQHDRRTHNPRRLPDSDLARGVASKGAARRHRYGGTRRRYRKVLRRGGGRPCWCRRRRQNWEGGRSLRQRRRQRGDYRRNKALEIALCDQERQEARSAG